MKKIILILSIILCSFSSCIFSTEEYATTQDDVYVETSVDVVRSTIDYNLVIRFGTPYYYNGSLLYYLYDGLYYYPYYYNNYWYFRTYRRPFNHLEYRPYFRPHRYDYRFDRSYRPQSNWYRNDRMRQDYKQPQYNRPNVRQNRPSMNNNMRRPNQPSMRSQSQIPHRTPSNRTSPSRGGGNFGGHRGGGHR